MSVVDGVDPQIDKDNGDIVIGFSTARHTMQGLRLSAAESAALGGSLFSLALKSALVYPEQAAELKRFREAQKKE